LQVRIVQSSCAATLHAHYIVIMLSNHNHLLTQFRTET